jgi:hypothetical protein
LVVKWNAASHDDNVWIGRATTNATCTSWVNKRTNALRFTDQEEFRVFVRGVPFAWKGCLKFIRLVPRKPKDAAVDVTAAETRIRADMEAAHRDGWRFVQGTTRDRRAKECCALGTPRGLIPTVYGSGERYGLTAMGVTAIISGYDGTASEYRAGYTKALLCLGGRLWTYAQELNAKL